MNSRGLRGRRASYSILWIRRRSVTRRRTSERALRHPWAVVSIDVDFIGGRAVPARTHVDTPAFSDARFAYARVRGSRMHGEFRGEYANITGRKKRVEIAQR